VKFGVQIDTDKSPIARLFKCDVDVQQLTGFQLIARCAVPLQ